MNQQPDKLFRDKLTHWQKTAPASAWDRIEVQIAEKRSPRKWFLAAASLLLLTAVSITIRWTSNNQITVEPLAASINVESPKIHSTITTPPAETTSVPEPFPTESNSNIALDEVDHKKFSPELKTAKPDKAKTEHNMHQARIAEVSGSSEKSITPQLPASPIMESAVEDEHFKLVLNASEVNERYFVEPLTPEATRGKKKSSAWKRLLVKAHKLKTNQDPLGEIRQAKSEILAWNFRNDNNKGNTKH